MSAPLSIFTVAERTYEHFTVSAQSLTVLIWAFAAGILLAAVYMLYQKSVPGSVVRAVLAGEALSEESAKTAAELGITGRLAQRELKRNVTLKRMIHRVEAEGRETRYFIPEEEKYRAELRYEREGKNPIVTFVLMAVMTFVFALLLIRLLPVFLNIADRLASIG